MSSSEEDAILSYRADESCHAVTWSDRQAVAPPRIRRRQDMKEHSRMLLHVTLLTMLERSNQLTLPKYTKFPEATDASTLKRIVKGMGLKYKKYQVETEDGYLLNLNRILNPDLPKSGPRGQPVLMVNGLFMHADSWLLHSKPEHNPAVAFLLAGYDIWLGDQRGSMRSLGHKNTTSEHKAFWDFSFHEWGIYDLPAFIDFILKKTRYTKLVYVGNSLGTTAGFVLLTEKPEYNDKVMMFLATMPVAVQPPLKTRPRGVRAFYILLKSIMKYYMRIGAGCIRDIPLMRKQLKAACLLIPNLYLWQLEMTSGPGMHPDMKKNRFCYQSSLQCGGASVKTILHTLQLFETGVFAQYDHGKEENMKRYNQSTPPMYKLGLVTSFVAAYYSNTDSYSPTESVKKMLSQLDGMNYQCEMKHTHHVDVLFGTQFHNFVPDMVQVLNSATGRTNLSKSLSVHCPPYKLKWKKTLDV